MNLAEFVEEALSEILSGIRAAQKKEGGGAIGAGILNSPQNAALFFAAGNGNFTFVEFDVSVVAESSAAGKGGLRVWSVGAVEGEGKRLDQQTNRIRFAVQLKIPEGDKVEHARGWTSPQ